MKKNVFTLALLFAGMLFGAQAMAQGRIELNAAKSAQRCANVTDEGFAASFTFNSIDAVEVSTEKGVFSFITMDNTYPSGNLGDPCLPAANKLLAIPYGVNNISVEVKSYSTEVYSLAEYGINRLYPQQPMLRKDQKPEDLPFAYNEKAYNAKGFANRPIAEVKIQGTLRGIQVGALTVNPVQYDAATNSIRVYNDIEVEVRYSQYDKTASYNEFARTFSPYFAGIYRQMFNWRDDVYDQHPDLWQAPVKMLVIADRMFESCMQEWIEWKTKKGIYMDVNYTDQIGNTASAITSFVQGKYAEDAPTFIMIMGDMAQVAPSATGSATSCVTDLYYMSVDGDEFADIFHSRFPAETVGQMQAMLDKALEYEQLAMPDPSYLSNVLLIAGEDSGWGVTVGRPTIWYASNYYYNEEHGFANVYEYSHGQYSGCYSHLNTGVGFVNYTAHGSNTSWAGPSLTVSDVNNLTNEHKYFLAMGNCCQAADWGISGACFGEAMVRAENKAAYAYIGSCPSTYWLNDYYFGVGATGRADGTMPDISETTVGCYDAMWDDNAYNTVCAIPFIGNLAGNAAQALGHEIHVSTLYCWQAYHVLGDGSIMPYRVEPTQNSVSHLPTVPIGLSYYTVDAAPGSYVGITKNGVLHGAGLIGESGSADIQIDPITSGGDVTICVTHPQHVPYIQDVPAAALDGAYLTFDDVQCEQSLVSGAYVSPTVSLKNVGIQTANNIDIVMTTESEYIDLISNTATIPSIAPEAVYEIANTFEFDVAVDIPNKTKVRFFLTCTSGNDVWETKFDLTFGAPVFVVESINNTELAPGADGTLNFIISNTGEANADNTVLEVYCSSDDLALESNTFELNTVDAGSTITVPVTITVGNNVAVGATYEINYLMTSGHYSVSGSYVISVGNILEGYETGDFNTYNWQFAGNANWVIVNDVVNSGTYAARSGAISDNQQSELTLTTEILANGDVSFYRKVSSETNYDKFVFLIDNLEKGVWSGDVAWSKVSYPVTAGTHTFTWRYVKDYSVSDGEDCAWIDDIQFPPTSVTLSLSPVTNLEANVTDNSVALTWTASEGVSTYVIRRNGEDIATQAGTSYSEMVADGIYTYSIVATDGDGHYSMPEFITVSVGTVGLEETDVNTFGIYPNPVSNTLYINGSDSEYSYAMFNGMGQMVASGSVRGNAEISVNDLMKGVYFLRLTNGTQVRMEKVVVK